ncbi:hypothetical protein GCM10018784_60620 [Streptomyces hydrogenans]|nr:hypothetical protein GCM10018784_60620 [Streptomyces hydrogenans]
MDTYVKGLNTRQGGFRQSSEWDARAAWGPSSAAASGITRRGEEGSRKWAVSEQRGG